jgi:hypothetical protein
MDIIKLLFKIEKLAPYVYQMNDDQMKEYEFFKKTKDDKLREIHQLLTVDNEI